MQFGEAVDINDAPSRLKGSGRKVRDPHERYDINEFNIKGSDKRGHDKNVQCRVTPELYSQLCVLVADPRTPYETPADVLRDSAEHRLEYLKDHLEDEEFQSALRDRQFHLKMAAKRARLKGWQQTLEEARETLDELQRAGDSDGVFETRVELEAFCNDGDKPESIVEAAKSLIRRYI